MGEFFCYTLFSVVAVISRRSFLSTIAGVVAPPMINRGRFRAFAHNPLEYSTLTLDVLQSTTSIDMLGLLTLNYRKFTAWAKNPERFSSSDFAALKASGVNVFHPAVGFEAGDIYTESFDDITDWNTFLRAHPDKFLRVETADDLQNVKVSGKIGIILGQQNSAHFRTVSDVDRFYKMGQRVSQLTYDNNRLGGGSTSTKDIGLTDFGSSIVARMNSIGMAIDVSHCDDRTTLDAIAASTKPVLVTHSNCRALVPHSHRCKTDQAIRSLAAKGGVLGVTMIRFFVRSTGTATIEDMLDHVDRVAKMVGVEHVGIGSDVDLVGHSAQANADLQGIVYPRKFFEITEGLVRRKYNADQIRMIIGANFQRALSGIWSA
jgi:membrane dipeptidase